MIYIYNIDKQNYPYSRLKLLVEKFKTTNQDFLRADKVFKPTKDRTCIHSIKEAQL